MFHQNLMNQIRNILKYFGTNIAHFGQNDGHANARSCDQTHQSSCFSYQKHSLKVSSKSDEPNSRDIGRRQFWTRLSQLPHPLFSFSRQPDFS